MLSRQSPRRYRKVLCGLNPPNEYGVAVVLTAALSVVEEAVSNVPHYNVERTENPRVDILVLKGDPGILENTSQYYCHLYKVCDG